MAGSITFSLPGWATGDGPDSDIALSTRARLARNLPDLPFPHRASEEERREVACRLRTAAGLGSNTPETLEAVHLSSLPQSDQRELVEAQLVSPLMVDGLRERWALLSHDRTLSLLLNEEDHLRLQAILPGNQPMAAHERVQAVATDLERRVVFARDERLGYLTADLSNVGTGLRLSVLLHLPALAFQAALTEKIRAIKRMDGTVRGVHGEGSGSLGALYQVSHAVTFGQSGSYFTRLVAGAAQRLIDDERTARATVLAESPKSVRSGWERAAKAIREAETLDAKTALRHLSNLRLAAAVGLAPGPDARNFVAQTLYLRTSGRSGSSRGTDHQGLLRAEALKVLLRAL